MSHEPITWDESINLTREDVDHIRALLHDCIQRTQRALDSAD